MIVASKPYWIKEICEEYMIASDMSRDEFHSHLENVLMGEDLGLVCGYTLASDVEDWDIYETLHWWAVSEYVDSNPGDPDLPEIIKSIEKD